MSVTKRFDHHAKLVAQMADTLGVDLPEQMQRGELDSEDLRQMVHKCTGCTRPGQCATWLAANAQGAAAAPSYCRNADTMAQLRG